MRLLLLAAALALTACAGYESRVSSLSDRELCTNLGVYTLKDHAEGIEITRDEIGRRNLDKARCERRANETAKRLRPEYKLSFCQRLADYHYEGEYAPFRETLDHIERLGMADEECATMARFRYQQMAREREDRARIAAAIQAATQEIAGRGSYANPLQIRIQ